MPPSRRAVVPSRPIAAEPAQGVTLADVALAAKVSLATASRVFSHPQLVREATAQRVHEAARRLSFRPNLLGAKLRAQRTRILGVMLPTLDNAVFAECWRGIEESAMAAGYSLMLVTSNYDPARERERIEYLLRHRVDGMVLTVADACDSTVLDQLDRESVPYVLAYNQVSDEGAAHGRHSVSVDNRTSACEGVKALIAAGHRRIVVISGAFTASDRARQRFAGYADAMRAHGFLIKANFTSFGSTRSAGVTMLRGYRTSRLALSVRMLAAHCGRLYSRMNIDTLIDVERHLGTSIKINPLFRNAMR